MVDANEQCTEIDPPRNGQCRSADPSRFAELLRHEGEAKERHYNAEMEQQREIEPFDAEAQRKIEENMQHALEHSPESFGRVNLL